MTPKTFSLDLREDGGARLALSYRAADRAGIQRLACDISAADLVRLVLFSETLGLQAFLGEPVAADLDLDGLQVGTEETSGKIRLVRRQGYNVQEASMDLSAFTAEMSGMAEVCLARAGEAKHGPVLCQMIEDSPMPAAIAQSLPADQAEQVFHTLCEMALLILSEEAETKGSDLARKLRAKKRQEEAREDVRVALDALSQAFLPPAGEDAPETGLRRQG